MRAEDHQDLMVGIALVKLIQGGSDFRRVMGIIVDVDHPILLQ
jgi:hypothetical protein